MASPTNKLTLNARYEKILVGSWIVIEQDDPGSVRHALWIFAKVTAVTHLSVARYGIAGKRNPGHSQRRLEKEFRLEAVAASRHDYRAHRAKISRCSKLPLTYPVYGSELPLNIRVDGLVAGQAIA